MEGEEKETLEQWLEGLEAAREANQSRMSTEEAIRLYYKQYPKEER